MNPNAVSKSSASLPSFVQQSPREKFEFCVAHHLEQYNAQKLVSFDMLSTSISLKVAVSKMTTMDKNLSFSILTEKSKALPHGGREAFHSYLIEAIGNGYEEVLSVENFLDEIEITSNRPPKWQGSDFESLLLCSSAMIKDAAVDVQLFMWTSLMHSTLHLHTKQRMSLIDFSFRFFPFDLILKGSSELIRNFDLETQCNLWNNLVHWANTNPSSSAEQDRALVIQQASETLRKVFMLKEPWLASVTYEHFGIIILLEIEHVMLQRPFLTESEFKHEFLNFWAKMVTIHVERVHKEDRYDALCLLKEFMDDTTDEQFPSVYEAKFWSQKIQKKIDQLG
jgi:hypothetical protein